MMQKQLLIFDSGVGGLSVFQEIMDKNPHINSFYLFDNACFPYGELDDNFLIQRLTTLLLSFVKQHHVDLIVIACNSASTVALSALRRHISIPVVGVVPAIKPAARLTKNGVIGLLATPATIRRNYTSLLIKEFAADIEVLKIGSTELVKLAEDKLHGLAVDMTHLQKILEPWLTLQNKPDTLVLGCTHFPLLKNEISSCFQSEVKLIDSGKAIAERVYQLLGGEQEKLSANQHKAYYTKPYELTAEQKLVELQRRFYAYGFQSLDYYAL
ncbi:MAG: glutamate racemase [Psychromonas sp.]|nr:glutamate racemase [Psychromonas sp.]